MLLWRWSWPLGVGDDEIFMTVMWLRRRTRAFGDPLIAVQAAMNAARKA